MILIKRKDGTVQVIPQGAVRMVEYLPSPGVLRIHFLGGEPSLDVRVSGGKGASCLKLFARQQVVQLEEDGVGEVQGQVGWRPGVERLALALAFFYGLLTILGWFIFRDEGVRGATLVHTQFLTVVVLLTSYRFRPQLDYLLPAQGVLMLTVFLLWGGLTLWKEGAKEALPALLGLFYLPLFFLPRLLGPLEGPGRESSGSPSRGLTFRGKEGK